MRPQQSLSDMENPGVIFNLLAPGLNQFRLIPGQLSMRVQQQHAAVGQLQATGSPITRNSSAITPIDLTHHGQQFRHRSRQIYYRPVTDLLPRTTISATAPNSPGTTRSCLTAARNRFTPGSNRFNHLESHLFHNREVSETTVGKAYSYSKGKKMSHKEKCKNR